MDSGLLLGAIFPALLIFAAACDALTMTIPNLVVLAIAAAFFIVAPLAGLDRYDVAAQSLCGLTVLSGAFFMFCRKWIGGGDAKLFAVTGLWLGWDSLLAHCLYTTIFGGMLSLAILFARTYPMPMPSRYLPIWLNATQNPPVGIPYGVALSLSALIAYSQSFWIQVILHRI